MKKVLSAFWIASLFILVSCEKSSNDPTQNSNNDKNSSSAVEISGLFSGTGTVMPNGIALGTYSGCITPQGWESNMLKGASFVDITSATDSTINITLSGGPFSLTKYTNIKVVKAAGSISFSFGHYDVNTRFLSLSILTGSYVNTGSCLQGLPYYYGGALVLSPGNYFYQTIGHIDFTGTKQ